MRKLFISTILAASTLAMAAPAAAQWVPAYGNQYGSQYGNGYGYNNSRGQVRVLQVRVNQLERQIRQLDRRNILSDREANRLRYQANMIERQLRVASHNGLNRNEYRSIELRLARLEQNIRYQATDGNRYGQNQYGYGNGYVGYDRDRDGRDDRYEDDRGYDHD